MLIWTLETSSCEVILFSLSSLFKFSFMGVRPQHESLENGDRSQTEDGRKGQNRQCSGFDGAGHFEEPGCPSSAVLSQEPN